MVRRLLRSISSLNHWNSSRSSDIQVLPSVGILSSSTRLYNQLSPNSEIIEETEDVDDQEPRKSSSSRARRAMKEVDLESSLRYMKSNAYKITYGDAKVWMPYRRNFAGAYPPKMTRKLCIRGGMLTTGNPCPLCRDEYLVIDEKNVDLLHQFIDVHTGEVISYEKTGVCQKRHKQLVIAVLRAYDQGYLEMPVPFREYNYADYMKQT